MSANRKSAFATPRLWLSAVAVCACLAVPEADTGDTKKQPPVDDSRARQLGAQHQHAGSAEATKQTGKVTLTIPDVSLVNEAGKPISFYSDLVKGRVVAINFLFTSCTTICPPLSAIFSNIQRLTRNRSGGSFQLISVSMDPVNDNPARMKAWLEKYGARPGWTFVSGDKSEVDKLLRALGGYVYGKEDHSPMVIIGNDASGVWTRIYGLGSAARLVGIIDEVSKGITPES
jgi:protein SCO1